MDDHTVDGNTAAGTLSEIFVGDTTLFLDSCGACGTTTVQAEVRVYVDAPGTVLRCPSCDAVLMRIVRLPRRVLVDFPSLARLEIPTAR